MLRTDGGLQAPRGRTVRKEEETEMNSFDEGSRKIVLTGTGIFEPGLPIVRRGSFPSLPLVGVFISQVFRAVTQLELILLPGDIWQCLGTFVVVTCAGHWWHLEGRGQGGC